MGYSMAAMSLPSKRRNASALLKKRRQLKEGMRIQDFSKYARMKRLLNASAKAARRRPTITRSEYDRSLSTTGTGRLVENKRSKTKDIEAGTSFHPSKKFPSQVCAFLEEPIQWKSASVATQSTASNIQLLARELRTLPNGIGQEEESCSSAPVKAITREVNSALQRGQSSDMAPKIATKSISKSVMAFDRSWHSEKLQTTGVSRPSMTCYRRSSLQALMHAPAFINWISHHNSGHMNDKAISNSHRISKGNGSLTGSCLACALRTFAAAYWKRTRDSREINSAALAIDRVISVLGSRPNFKLSTRSIHEQGDPMEFIIWILGFFDAFKPIPMPQPQLHALFQVKLNVRRVCKRCGTKEAPGRTQLGFNISLPIAKSRGKPFTRHLHNFFNDEGTPGQCAKCRSKHQMPEELRIQAAPEILFIHIDRNFFGRQKIRDVVDFPTELDLTKYMVQGEAKTKAFLEYRIGAVISHQGGLHGGHYVSTTRSPGGIFTANDMDTRRASFEALGRQKGSFEPVVLMYLKR